MSWFNIQQTREDEIRKEAGASTRKQLLRALMDLPEHISQRTSAGFNSLITGSKETIQKWFAQRLAQQEQIIQQRLDAQVEQLLQRLPQATYAKMADAYRQRLIKKIGEHGRDFFATSVQRRSAELLLSVQNAVERQRGVLSSGDEPLPEGTRYFFRTASGMSIYVIEQPPTVRTVQFTGDHRGTYRLAFPFVVAILRFDRYGRLHNPFIFFRNERLKSLNDPIFTAALPNMGNDGVCFPGLLPQDQNLSIADKAERALATFWGSAFNDDLASGLRLSMRSISAIRSMNAWQRGSAKNPLFVLSLNWLRSSYQTLGNCVRQIADDTVMNEDKKNLTDIVAGPLHHIASQVSSDVMEAALQLVPSMKVEAAPAEFFAGELKKVFDAGLSDLKDSLGKAQKEIFAEVPTLDRITSHGEVLKTWLAQEVNQRVQWIGLSSSADSTADLRHWRN